MKSAAVARLLGSTVLSQAILSGGGFLVAFILLRRLGAESYGLYVLVSVTLILLATLQGAFFLVTVTLGLAGPHVQERQSLVARTVRARRQVLAGLGAAGLVLLGLVWGYGYLSVEEGALVLAGGLAGITVLWREFCRGVLLAHQRAAQVLSGDAIYVFLWVLGTWGATYLPMATVFAVVSMGAAAWVSGVLMKGSIWRFEPWGIETSKPAWHDVTAHNAWSAFGAGVHWSFNQGYTYVVAAMIDVRAVAALAATRLFLMPVNMLSTGVNQSLFPLVSRWNQEVRVLVVFGRVMVICAVLSLACLMYALMVWWGQDWLFDVLIRQSFEHAKLLIALWTVVFILTISRDQIGCILVARLRLRAMGQLTFVSAATALMTMWLSIPVWGAAGALFGILVGEILNLLGLLVLFAIEARRDAASRAPA